VVWSDRVRRRVREEGTSDRPLVELRELHLRLLSKRSRISGRLSSLRVLLLVV